MTTNKKNPRRSTGNKGKQYYLDKFGPNYWTDLAARGGKAGDKKKKAAAGKVGGFALSKMVDPDYYARIRREAWQRKKDGAAFGAWLQSCPDCGARHKFKQGVPDFAICTCGKELWYIPKD